MKNQKIKFNAKIVSGLGAASSTLKRQLPLIRKQFNFIQNCWPGTINLRLSEPVNLLNVDFETTPIAWTPSGKTTESFGFIEIALVFPGRLKRVQGWLYLASNSPHRHDNHTFEVITQKLNLEGVSDCQIYIRSSAIEISRSGLKKLSQRGINSNAEYVPQDDSFN